MYPPSTWTILNFSSSFLKVKWSRSVYAPIQFFEIADLWPFPGTDIIYKAKMSIYNLTFTIISLNLKLIVHLIVCMLQWRGIRFNFNMQNQFRNHSSSTQPLRTHSLDCTNDFSLWISHPSFNYLQQAFLSSRSVSLLFVKLIPDPIISKALINPKGYLTFHSFRT